MNDSTRASSYLPAVALRLGLVVLATFLGAMLAAQLFGERLAASFPAARSSSSCASGECPAMLPCGLPLTSFEVRGSTPGCCEADSPAP